MAKITEIPLVPSRALVFNTALGATRYNLRLTYDIAQEGCWILDIGDEDQKILIAGIPLVTGVDLLGQYSYMNFGGSLIVTTDRGAGGIPGFDDLGVTSRLFFITN